MNKKVMQERLKLVEAKMKEVSGLHAADIRNFIDGKVSVNKKGDLKITLNLPAEELLQDPTSINDVIQGNWKIVPLLVFVEEK